MCYKKLEKSIYFIDIIGFIRGISLVKEFDPKMTLYAGK